MCRLRRKDYAGAETDCVDVLAKEPGSLKALFRLAKAQLALEKWDAAKGNFKKMLAQDEGNVEARRGVAEILRRERAQRDKEKQLYAGKKLFGKPDERSSAKPTAALAVPADPAVVDPDEPPPPPAPVPPDQDPFTGEV